MTSIKKITTVFVLAMTISFGLMAKGMADSVLLYTLKENERIVMVTEHRLLVSNTGIGHLLFLSRPAGYFILYNGREFGPFETLSFRESNVSLMDWAVRQKGKWYQLLLDKGLLIGPYDDVVDLYRSGEFYDFFKGTDYSGNHWGFRARRGEQWYSIVNGKEYGPYKDIDMGTPHFANNAGQIRASLVSYTYNYRTGFSKSLGDSVLLGNIPVSEFQLRDKILYQNGKVYRDQVVHFAEDITRKNNLRIDTSGAVFLNENRLLDCPKIKFSSGSYYNERPEFIFSSGQAAIKLSSKYGEDYFYYLTLQKKQVGPFNDANAGSLWFTRDATHYAYRIGTKIVVDEKVVHKKGFSLVHNPAKDCFSWLTVKDRSIFLHSLKP